MELRAWYSLLSWSTETRLVIEQEFKNCPAPAAFRWLLLPSVSDEPLEARSLQIHAFRDTLEATLVDGEWKYEGPKPAALVYSMHGNGSMTVLLSPFINNSSKVDGSTFLIDWFPDARDLSGSAGRRIIRRHMNLFRRLCANSILEATPNRHSARFIDWLHAKNDRYRWTYESHDAARKNRIEQDMVFAIALITGVVASTIFPLVRDIGNESAKKVAEKLKVCETAKSIDLCQTGSDIHFYDEVGHFVTSESVVLVAFVLVVIGTLVLVRRYRRR